MEYLSLKNRLEKMPNQELAKLVRYYGINEANSNDQLWKLALSIMTDKKPKQNAKGTHSYVHQQDVSGLKEYTIDNDSFLVRVDEDGIHIYSYPDRELVYTIVDYQGYWWGFDPNNPKNHGNTLLIDINDHEYIFVGSFIYLFNTKDVIRDYVSPVDATPMAIGDDNVYLIADQLYIPEKQLSTTNKSQGKRIKVVWLFKRNSLGELENVKYRQN